MAQIASIPIGQTPLAGSFDVDTASCDRDLSNRPQASYANRASTWLEQEYSLDDLGGKPFTAGSLSKVSRDLAAFDITTVYRTSEQCSAASARERAQRTSANEIGQHAAANCAYHQTRAAVIPLAISSAILATIDAVVTPQSALAIVAALVTVGRIPAMIIPVALPASVIVTVMALRHRIDRNYHGRCDSNRHEGGN